MKETVEEVLALFKYEWHEPKSQMNLSKHAIDFNRAKEIFTSNYKTTVQFSAVREEDKELRQIIMMLDQSTKLAYRLVFCIRESKVRFISCSRIKGGDNLSTAKNIWKQKGFL